MLRRLPQGRARRCSRRDRASPASPSSSGWASPPRSTGSTSTGRCPRPSSGSTTSLRTRSTSPRRTSPTARSRRPTTPTQPVPVHARRGRRPRLHVQPARHRRPADHQPHPQHARSIAKIFLGEITNWNDPAIAAAQPASWRATCPTRRSSRCTDRRVRRELPAVRLPPAPGRADFVAAQNGLPISGNPGPADGHLAGPGPGGRTRARPSTRDGARATWIGRAARTTQPTTWPAVLEPRFDHLRRDGLRQGTRHFPVASINNASNQAVQPTSLNVATALEKAILHTDLTQDLTGVYTNPLPNAYPLSAYSYLVTPCSPQLGCRAGQELRLVHRTGGPADRPRRLSTARRARSSGSSSPSWPAPARRRWPQLGYSPAPPEPGPGGLRRHRTVERRQGAAAGLGGRLQEPLRRRPDPPAR